MLGSERRLVTNRKQDVAVYLLPSGRHFQVEAEMQDEVHHMRIRMTVNHPSLKIKEVELEMPGVPDPLCTEARELAESLLGQNAVSGIQLSREGRNGTCLLLKDLFRTVLTMLIQAQYHVSRAELTGMFPGITEEQLFKIWTFARPDLKNSCLRYADDSPFMQRVEEAQWPRGVEKLLQKGAA